MKRKLMTIAGTLLLCGVLALGFWINLCRRGDRDTSVINTWFAGQTITSDDLGNVNVSNAEPNEWTILDANKHPEAVLSYGLICGAPTHECPIHGPIGYMSQNQTMCISYDGEDYHFCGYCAMKYVSSVLKENIPQIRKISKGETR